MHVGVPSHVKVSPSNAMMWPLPQSNENGAMAFVGSDGNSTWFERPWPSVLMNIPMPFPYTICLPVCDHDGMEISWPLTTVATVFEPGFPTMIPAWPYA